MFNKRVWLNSDTCSSTGSIVAFHGKTSWHQGEEEEVSFLEIADCHVKVRLHKIYSDTDRDFLNKMKLLKAVLDEFIAYLERMPNNALAADVKGRG